MALLQQIKSISISGYGSLPLADNKSSFQPSLVERERVSGQRDSDSGFIDKDNTGAIVKATINHRAGIDQQEINAMTSVMITIKLSDGETHVMPEACNIKAGEIGSSGQFDIEFHSAKSLKR